MNWNSRDRFSASIEEHSQVVSPLASSSQPLVADPPPEGDLGAAEAAPEEGERQAIFDPFSTIYEWSESNQPESNRPEPDLPESGAEDDFDNCESMFVENRGAFFDPLQTIVDYEEADKRDGEAEGANSGGEGTTGDGRRDEFVFVEGGDPPPSPPPSPTNDLDLDSYCLVSNPDSYCLVSNTDESERLERSSGAADDSSGAGAAPRLRVDDDDAAGATSAASAVSSTSESGSSSSVTSSAGSSSMQRSPSLADSSVDSSSNNSSEGDDASSTNTASSRDESDEPTFEGLLVRDLPLAGSEPAGREWLPSNIAIRKSRRFEESKTNSDSRDDNGAVKACTVQRHRSDRAAVMSICAAGSAEQPRSLEIDLAPGLQMSEEAIVTRDALGRRRRAFGLSVSKSSYVERLYLRATNPTRNDAGCFSQSAASRANRFGSIASGLSFGLKKLENIIPRLSLEAYNVLNCERVVDVSTGNYETLRRLRRAVGDAMFFTGDDGRSQRLGASRTRGCETGDDSSPRDETRPRRDEASKRIDNDDEEEGAATRSSRSIRLLRTLSQRISQRLLSRDETVEAAGCQPEGRVEVPAAFKREEIVLEFADECSLDVSLCNEKSATNLKVGTRLFVTLFLNRPFRLTLALNDRRYELRDAAEDATVATTTTTAATTTAATTVATTTTTTTTGTTYRSAPSEWITIREASTCARASADYSERRELILEGRTDALVAKRFEAMRVKVFRGDDSQVDDLPLRLSARLEMNDRGLVKLNAMAACRRQCRDVLLRFYVPPGSQGDAGTVEARGSGRRMAAAGFSRLQTLFGGRGIDGGASRAFEVSHGEAWFNEADGEIAWRMDQMAEQKDASRPAFLLLKFSLPGFDGKDGPGADWPGSGFEPANRFARISFVVDDHSASKVDWTLVRVDGRPRTDDQRAPLLVVRHATRFEYCVEMEVSGCGPAAKATPP